MRTVRPQLPTSLPCRVALIGEAPGEVEEARGKPFVGPSGYQLNEWLGAAGIKRESCLIDNVMSWRPRPDLDALFVTGKEFQSLLLTQGARPGDDSIEYRVASYPCRKGRYLPPLYWGELTRLYMNLAAYAPNVIVAIGGFALWALTGKLGIQSYCGFVIPSHLGVKVVPCIHPAAILRNYAQRLACIRAMRRAAEESNSSGSISENTRKVHFVETRTEALFALSVLHEGGKLLSIDIETAPSQGVIRSISLGTDEHESYCFVFSSTDWGAGSFWDDEDDEIAVILALRTILESSQPKLFHKGTYDIGFIWLAWGIRVHAHREDTLLKHHAFSPEQGKKLLELGVKYCADLGPWKARWAQREEVRDK